MKFLITMAFFMTLSACGLESAGSAVAAAKLQAQQAKQAQQTVEKVKANINVSMQAAEESQRKADEQAGK